MSLEHPSGFLEGSAGHPIFALLIQPKENPKGSQTVLRCRGGGAVSKSLPRLFKQVDGMKFLDHYPTIKVEVLCKFAPHPHPTMPTTTLVCCGCLSSEGDCLRFPVFGW